MADGFAFVGAVLLVLIGMMLLGYLALGPLRTRHPAALMLLSPSCGLVITIAISCGFSLGTGLPSREPVVVTILVLVGLGALRFAIDMLDPLRRDVFWCCTRSLLAGLVLITSTITYSVYSFRALWGQGYLPAVSWNNDILIYAYHAKYMAVAGSGSQGWIDGFDNWWSLTHDVPGSFSLLVPTGAVLGDELHATMPTLCALVCASVLSAFVLLHFVARVNLLVSALASLIIPVTFSFSYNSYQFFLSERIAICIVLFAIAYFSLASRARTILAAQALITFTLLLSYEHALVFEIPLAAGAIATVPVADKWGFSRDGLRKLVHFGLGTALGALLLAPHLAALFSRFKSLATTPAGWPMPTTTMLQALGLQSIDIAVITVEQRVVLYAIASACAVLAISVGANYIATGRINQRVLLTILLLLPYAAFCYLALNEPGSYRQWKAMAFAVPFLVIAVAMTLQSVTDLASRSRWVGTRASAMIGIVIVALWLGAVAHHTFRPTDWITNCVWLECPVNDRVREEFAQVEPQLGNQLTAVDMGSFWPSMAAVYLLWGHPLALRQPTYYSVSNSQARQAVTYAPDGTVTLVRRR